MRSSRKPLILAMTDPAYDFLAGLIRVPRWRLLRLFDFDILSDPTLEEATQSRGSRPPSYQLRSSAWTLIASHRWRTSSAIILLGREISLAFGMRRRDPALRWMAWAYWGKERQVAVVPHPRNSTGWWRRPGNEARARSFLRELGGLSPEDPQGRLEVVAED